MASLRRLNLDSSWLLTLPTSSEHPTRTLNIAIDPWLDPAEQVDFAASFSWQKRVEPALASSIEELEKILQRQGRRTDRNPEDGRPDSERVDAIILSHPFTDHMHPPTLKACLAHRSIPILATGDTVAALKRLVGRDADVVAIPQADMDVPPSPSAQSLPSNISVLQAIPQDRFSLLRGPAGMAWKRLHGGLIICWTSSDEVRRTILYSPHGITPISIPAWLKSTSPAALLTSFDRIELPVWLSGTVNLGLQGAIDILTTNAFCARYLIDTHSEHKEKRGLVAALLRRYWLGGEIQTGFDAEKENNRRQAAQERLNEAGITDTTVLTPIVGETVTL